MGFNLSSFGSGVADGITTAYEAKADRRKEAVSSKRSLMFNATEAIYNNALDVKKSNDKIKNEDKKYISMVRSMDPNISTDNMNKLLSLSVDDRAKAQGEFNYRASQSESNVSSFGDFMSYVNDASDLSNPDKIDRNIESSMMTATETPKAYYDKTGLVSDESVNNMYSEVSGVLSDVHGMSVAQAKAITEQGIYSVQHPPIKINWSKDIQVERGVQEEIAKASIYSSNQLKGQALSIINTQVTLTGTAIDKLRESFAADYMIEQQDEDGNLTGIKQKAGAAFASTAPNFESDFRSSPAYLKYAKESISPYIMSMETDPDANKANAMTYINGTFPGLYGGTITVSTLTEDEFAAIVPTKIYYVSVPPLTGPANPSGADSDGFIWTGAQVQSKRQDKPQVKEDKGGNTEKLTTTNTDSGDALIKEAEVAILQKKLDKASNPRARQLIERRIEEVMKPIVVKSVIRPLTDYQNVMMEEKRGTIGAAKAYDQAVDIAIEAGDMEGIRKVQATINSLTASSIGLGVSDMLDDLNEKIEAALKE
jgi:hypothetical protein